MADAPTPSRPVGLAERLRLAFHIQKFESGVSLLSDAVEDLVALASEKGLITDAEGARLRALRTEAHALRDTVAARIEAHILRRPLP